MLDSNTQRSSFSIEVLQVFGINCFETDKLMEFTACKVCLTIWYILTISIHILDGIVFSSSLFGSLSVANGQCNNLRIETFASVNSRFTVVAEKEFLQSLLFLNVLCRALSTNIQGLK